MHEQFINEYYISLEYNAGIKEKALTKISTLSEGQLKNVNDFSKRFLKAASIIEKNLSLFNSACEHVDIVTTILEYLTNFGVKFMFDQFDKEEEYNKEELILSVVLTIFNICREYKVQLFLENAIIKNSSLYKNKIQYDRLKNQLSNQTNEMILLKDSDLYAVVSYLMIIGHSRINKIWVQISVKQKFLSLIKKYFRLKDLTICIWTFAEELIPRTSYNMNIISIWSEDVIHAKYLATLLDRDVIFINMHMDLYGGVMLLPWIKIFDKLHKTFKPSFIDSIQPSINEVNIPSDAKSISIYNLFYDGKWHKPIKDTYWKHNGSLWANATRKILRDADKLIKCLQFNEISLLSQNDKLEVIQDRIPRGVIILKEKTEETLFFRLIQILISGNSVIVLTDANSCNLVPYCDMFSSSKIPRGVINVLSNENTSDIELSLCATDYATYEKQFFTCDLEKTCINLTLPKQIVLSLK